MIRKHENSDSYKAGFYAIAVHAILLVGMLVSFNWKAAHPVMNVTEVELWDKIPAQKSVEEPKPIIKEQPKPEPIIKEEPKPVIKEEPKPEEPKVDIELEKKKKEEVLKKEKERLEKTKKEEERKKIAQQMRDEDLQEKKEAKKADADALKKAQQEFLAEEKGNDDKQASAANASLLGEYTDKIKVKIRGNITAGLCGDGNPVLKVRIGVLPTGQLASGIKIAKSSGISTCDEAVERAILASEPFQLPDDAKLKAEFRDLDLTIKPNN